MKLCKYCKYYMSDNQCPIPSHMLREGTGCRMFEDSDGDSEVTVG